LGRKRIFIGVAVAVAVLLIAGEFLTGFLRLEDQRRTIERKLSEAVGLAVSIGGDLRLHLLPALRFEVADVRVANLPGRPSPHLLAIDSVDLALDPWRLLRGAIEIDSLTLVGAEVHVETDAQGGFPVAHDADALVDEEVSGPLDLRIRRFEAQDARVFLLDGESGRLTTLHLSELSLAAEDFDGPITFEARGEIDGAGFDLVGSGGALEELLQPTAPYPIELAGQLLEAAVEVDGTVAAPFDLRGLDVGFSAEIQDLSGLAYDTGNAVPRIPRIGPITVSGRLTDPDGVLGVRELAITAAGESGARGEVAGAIADLEALRGVVLEARLDTEDLAFLEPFAERPLPDDASLHASATLSDRDGSLGIAGTVKAATPDGRLSLEVTGAHDDIRRLDEIDVRVGVHARDLAVIGNALGLAAALPPIGPVDGAARLRDRDGALAIEDIGVTLGSRDENWAEVQGVIGNLERLRGVQLTVSLRAPDADGLAARFGREIPDIGSVRGSVRMADADGTLGIESLELHGGRAGSLAIDLSGSFDDLRAIDEIELEAEITASDLGAVGALFGTDLPAIGPIEFAGRVKGSDEKIVSSGTLRIDKTVLSGDWSASFVSGSRPSVKARINSPHVHLDDLGIEPRSAASPTPVRDAAAAAKPRWSEGPLPFEQLRAVDLDLELRADRVTGRSGLDLTDARTFVHLDDGELTIHELETGYETGSAEILFRVDSRTAVPSLAFLGNARGVDLTRFMSQFQENTGHAGLLDLAIEVESRGRSFDEILSQLAGRAEGRLRDGTLASKYGREFMLEVAHLSIPDFRPRAESPIDCFAVALDIDGGVAHVETLRVDAPRIIVTGTGNVNLASNAFELRLTPEPRDPSLLSIAATVKVRGPITNPTFRAVRRSLATSATRALVSNVWRPARTLTQPFRRSNAEDGTDDCPLDPFVPDFR
jgi:uncharacterized protein involved in outer membrane biogenesis